VTASAHVGAVYLFAIETAMRAGEICSLEWQYVNERHVHLPQTKNGYGSTCCCFLFGAKAQDYYQGNKINTASISDYTGD